MIKQITVRGYRSIRDLSLELQPINVLTGPNGCGKSNLYNSLVLIGRAAQGLRRRWSDGDQRLLMLAGARRRPTDEPCHR